MSRLARALTGKDVPDHEAARDEDMRWCMASRVCRKPWDCHDEGVCYFVAAVEAHDARQTKREVLAA